MNQLAQGALPDPKAACDPATEDSVDLEFEILDVEGEILAVASELADRARSATSFREYLLPPERLATFSPADRLKLLRRHLSRLQNRLTPDSASAPRQNEPDQMLREDSGQQTLVASEPASQPAAIGGSNALASIRMPSCTNACAVQPPNSRRDSPKPASEDSEPASQPADRNALASDDSDPNLPKPSNKKKGAKPYSGFTFVGRATPVEPVRAIPPLPPCSSMGVKTSAPRIACLWPFLVTACQHLTTDYALKGERGVRKRSILADFDQATGISIGTARNYLTGPSRKFTWPQVFSAAGLCNATSPPLHTLDCRSQQYISLVGALSD